MSETAFAGEFLKSPTSRGAWGPDGEPGSLSHLTAPKPCASLPVLLGRAHV